MQNLKQLWQKRWFKNLLFFSFISVAYFTNFPLWVNIQFTKLGLDSADQAIVGKYGESVYRSTIVLEGVDGNNFDLSMYEGKPLFINFWASWCVPCLAEFGSLEKLQNEFPGIEFIYVTNEQESSFKNYVENTDYPFNFYQLKSTVPNELGFQGIPTSFLLNERGEIVLRQYGAANWSDQETIDKIKSLLL